MAHAIIHTCGELVNPAEVVLDLSRQKVLVTNAVSRDRATLGELIGHHRFVLATTDAEVKQAKDHAQAIVFAHFRGDTRLKANVEQVTALGLDFDALDEDSAAAVRSRLHELGAAYVRYTTFSHGRVAGTHSFRAMLPISRAMTIEEFERVAPQLHARFPECDVQARDSARAWLLPMALVGGAPPEREFHPGRVIDVDAMLAQSAVSAVSSPTKPTRAKAPASAGRKRGQRGPRHEEAEVLGMLAAVSADCDRTTWLKVAFALCERDEVEGRRLWQDWSATGGGQYAGEAETQRVWEREVVPRVNSNDAAYRFDIDGLAKLAQEGGWRPPTMIPGKNGGRAKVYLSDGDGQLNAIDVAQECLSLLRTQGSYYSFQGILCQVRTDDTTRAQIDLLDIIKTTRTLCQLADWHSRGDQEAKRLSKPPRTVVDLLRSLPEPEGPTREIPQLVGIATVPYLDDKGELHTVPGYNPQTGVYLAPHGLDVRVDLPEQPELLRAAAAAAAARISRHFHEVPFRSDLHRAAGLSLIMTMCAPPSRRPSPSPLFLLNANTSGAGKTRYAVSAYFIATGEAPALAKTPPTQEEWQKQIVTWAISGETVIILDNNTEVIGGAALESAVTGTKISGRRLGLSEAVKADFAPCWVVTVNNASITPDMVGRTIEIYLESPHADPRAAEFEISESDWLESYLPSARGQIVSDLLTIQLAYRRAGRPAPSGKMGSFSSWARSVGAPIWYATGHWVRDTQIELRELADDETAELQPLLSAWPTGRALLARDIASYRHDGSPESMSFSEELDSFLTVSRATLKAKTVTTKLKHIAGRRVLLADGVTIARMVCTKDHSGVRVWSVVRERQPPRALPTDDLAEPSNVDEELNNAPQAEE